LTESVIRQLSGRSYLLRQRQSPANGK
jgi:hypothetical protein